MDKILFTATESLNHIQAFHLPYLKWFKEHGYEVHVATKREGDIPYCDVLHDMPFERSPFKISNIKAYFELKKIIDGNSYKLIHCHTPVGAAITRLAAKKARKSGTKVLYTAHGFHFFKGVPLINWLLYYPAELWLSKYTDCVITINDEDFTRAKGRQFKFGNVEYVHGVGVDLDKFFPVTNERKNTLRKQYGYTHEDFILICVGELTYRKHQDYLFTIIDALKTAIPNIKLLLVGKGILEKDYNEALHNMNLEANFKMLGYRNDIPDLMALSDAAISTSRQEGLPVNLLEAMSSGLPIIASNCRGNRDLVVHESNGLLFALNEPTKVINSIKALANSPDLREKFGQTSRNLVERYSVKKVLAEMEQIYAKYL